MILPIALVFCVFLACVAVVNQYPLLCVGGLGKGKGCCWAGGMPTVRRSRDVRAVVGVVVFLGARV
jgi:hypothetical protein